MATNTQFLTHRFDGGWAPDFGKLVSGLPTQTSQVPIPFVLEAQNIFWELDGGFRKIGGTTKIGSELESGAVIYGVYDYWRMGTTGSANRRKVCHVGTTIKEDGDASTWVNLFTGLEDTKHPSYATFADLLIIASDSTTDVPKSWDMSTAQNLAGSPPNFAFSTYHKNRMWAGGNVAFPSRLYYSAADDPEDWTGAGSGFIDISPGDGDEIRGLAGEFKNDLWVFKGPNKGSIHRITGSTPSDFSRIPFIQGLACVSHSSVSRFRDDILFMTPSGSIRSLKATAAFGDFHDAALTFPIHKWLIDNVNKSALKKTWVINDPTTSHLYVAVPTAASTTNDTILCYDYQFAAIEKPDRWSRILDWPAHSLGTFVLSGLPRLMGGGADGFVRDLNANSKNIDTTGAIDAYVETPHMNYGTSTQFKTVTQAGITLTPSGGDDVTFSWTRDSQFTEEEIIAQGSSGVELGDATNPSIDDFLLGEDVASSSSLSGITFNEAYADLVDGGAGRWIQYGLRQPDVDADLYVHAFNVGLQFDAHGTE